MNCHCVANTSSVRAFLSALNTHTVTTRGPFQAVFLPNMPTVALPVLLLLHYPDWCSTCVPAHTHPSPIILIGAAHVLLLTPQSPETCGYKNSGFSFHWGRLSAHLTVCSILNIVVF